VVVAVRKGGSGLGFEWLRGCPGTVVHSTTLASVRRSPSSPPGLSSSPLVSPPLFSPPAPHAHFDSRRHWLWQDNTGAAVHPGRLHRQRQGRRVQHLVHPGSFTFVVFFGLKMVFWFLVFWFFGGFLVVFWCFFGFLFLCFFGFSFFVIFWFFWFFGWFLCESSTTLTELCLFCLCVARAAPRSYTHTRARTHTHARPTALCPPPPCARVYVRV
jgi:hypothetical protein